ncbi:MAG: phage integrase N-terminal SAM-like domain-containing protein [bacterium]
MTPLRAKMIDEMKLRRFAPNTQEAYVSAVEGLARFYNQPPDRLDLMVFTGFQQTVPPTYLSPSKVSGKPVTGLFSTTTRWPGSTTSESI